MEHVRHARRPATALDEDFIYALKREALGEYVVRTWGSWDEAHQRRRFRELFDPARWEIVLAREEPIGAVALEWEAARVFLANLEILPAWQRRGVGTAILEDTLAAACRRGLPVELRVLKVNPARALYERLGFRVIEETSTHLRMRAER